MAVRVSCRLSQEDLEDLHEMLRLLELRGTQTQASQQLLKEMVIESERTPAFKVHEGYSKKAYGI